jgi:transcriptional regulator of acetoin/glycerol metabolism
MTQPTPADAIEGHAEPDIVKTILQRVLARVPGCEASVAEIEAEIRAEFGGMRVRIPKRKKHPTASERRKAFSDGLSGMSTDEVTKRNGISRATLYDYMKRFSRD